MPKKLFFIKNNTDSIVNIGFIVVSMILVVSIINFLVDNKKYFTQKENFDDTFDLSLYSAEMAANNISSYSGNTIPTMPTMSSYSDNAMM
jgi:hypothetical protein